MPSQLVSGKGDRAPGSSDLHLVHRLQNSLFVTATQISKQGFLSELILPMSTLVLLVLTFGSPFARIYTMKGPCFLLF